VNVAIEIPDDIGRLLAGQAGDLSRAVLEAVAVEAYRSGAITPAQSVLGVCAIGGTWLGGEAVLGVCAGAVAASRKKRGGK